MQNFPQHPTKMHRPSSAIRSISQCSQNTQELNIKTSLAKAMAVPISRNAQFHWQNSSTSMKVLDWYCFFLIIKMLQHHQHHIFPLIFPCVSLCFQMFQHPHHWFSSTKRPTPARLRGARSAAAKAKPPPDAMDSFQGTCGGLSKEA